MEIDANSSRVGQPGYTSPATRTNGSSRPGVQAEAASSSAELLNRLQQLSLVRPEKVSEAQNLMLDDKYPPEDVLDRIAVLLAARFDEEE